MNTGNINMGLFKNQARCRRELIWNILVDHVARQLFFWRYSIAQRGFFSTWHFAFLSDCSIRNRMFPASSGLGHWELTWIIPIEICNCCVWWQTVLCLARRKGQWNLLWKKIFNSFWMISFENKLTGRTSTCLLVYESNWHLAFAIRWVIGWNYLYYFPKF